MFIFPVGLCAVFACLCLLVQEKGAPSSKAIRAKEEAYGEVGMKWERDMRKETAAALRRVEESVYRCAVCGSVGTAEAKLQRCGSCKRVEYCSVACQRADWKAHKPLCKSEPSLL